MEINYSLTVDRLDQVRLTEPRTFGELELDDYTTKDDNATANHGGVASNGKL